MAGFDQQRDELHSHRTRITYKVQVDGDVGNLFWVGILEIETGAFKVLREFATHYEHAQFSPVYANLFLLAQDWRKDKRTGKHMRLDHRLLLMDINETIFEPVEPRNWYDHSGKARQVQCFCQPSHSPAEVVAWFIQNQKHHRSCSQRTLQPLWGYLWSVS